MRIKRFVLAACFLVALWCDTSADEPTLDAASALQKSFETREKLVKGSCTITGVNHMRWNRSGPGPDTELKLKFDFSVPVFRIEEHGTGIYQRTKEYQYQTPGTRTVIYRMPLRQDIIRDPIPFHLNALGFQAEPNASLRDIDYLDYASTRDRLLASEILEAEMEDGLLRIRLERPRVDGDHYAVQYQVWLDPSKEYLPTRIEEFGADPKRRLLYSDLTWKSIQGTWVPTSFKQSFRNDMRWEFDWHRVNEALPESDFELDSFPLKGETIELRDREPSGRTTKVGTVQGF